MNDHQLSLIFMEKTGRIAPWSQQGQIVSLTIPLHILLFYINFQRTVQHFSQYRIDITTKSAIKCMLTMLLVCMVINKQSAQLLVLTAAASREARHYVWSAMKEKCLVQFLVCVE